MKLTTSLLGLVLAIASGLWSASVQASDMENSAGKTPARAIPHDIPKADLPEPIYFKAVSVELIRDPSATTTFGWRRVPFDYHGLALRAHTGRVNGAVMPFPSSWNVVVEVTDVNGKAWLYDIYQIRSFIGDGKQSGELLLRDGKQVRVMNGTISMPTELRNYRSVEPTFDRKDVQFGGLVGNLIDVYRKEVSAETSLDLGRKQLVSLQLAFGPEAEARFREATAEFNNLRKQAAAAKAAERKSLDAWRASLREGAQTSCGMVVEKKKEIANIQTDSGTKWIRIDLLTQPGQRGSCN